VPNPSDPNATLEDDQDPDEDTLTDPAEDTDQDTQGAVDWEARYKQLQAYSTRRDQELAAAREGSDDGDDEDEDEEGYEEEPDEAPDRLMLDSWRLAEKEYGKEAIRAYDKAARILDRASTPADYMAAFEAYHADRLASEVKKFEKQQQQSGGGQAQGQTSRPPVDTNRADAAPRNYDAQSEAALAKGDSRSWLLAQVQRVRGE
jgi:hypothetical protein